MFQEKTVLNIASKIKNFFSERLKVNNNFLYLCMFLLIEADAK